jgi:histidine triad (HIT) family protein
VTIDCLFCRIVAGEVPAEHVASDEGVIAIRDIAPRAPVHVLVLPERHVTSVHELAGDDDGLLLACLALARRVADQEGISEGYRLVTNVGPRGGQTVFHMHVHVLGGRQLGHIDSLG